MLVLGAVAWAVPVGLVAWLTGLHSVFTDQALFFCGAALVTFGGAYAVLAYVAQQAVEVYGWLGPGEMVRGLALAESTPGPLIMVVQFVAFVGAYLALFFALHTLVADTTRPAWGPLSLELPVLDNVRPVAIGLTVLAALLLFRVRWSVLRTLGVCAAAGLALGLVGVPVA